MKNDDGSAAVEFLLLTLLLFVPIVYLVLSVFAIQGASFAAAGAARDGSRILATASDPEEAFRTIELSAQLAFADFGLDVDPIVTIECEAECTEPGSLVSVTVSARVPLPLLPSFVADRASVPIDAHATGVVDRFRER